MGSPRVDVVFRSWQCDKENHGWREGPPRPFPAKVSICWPGLHPPDIIRFKREKNTAFRRGVRPPLGTLAGIKGLFGRNHMIDAAAFLPDGPAHPATTCPSTSLGLRRLRSRFAQRQCAIQLPAHIEHDLPKRVGSLRQTVPIESAPCR
jgi:hypothetical protein